MQPLKDPMCPVATLVQACSGWGWTFIIVLAAASVLYVGGGVSVHGAPFPFLSMFFHGENERHPNRGLVLRGSERKGGQLI